MSALNTFAYHWEGPKANVAISVKKYEIRRFIPRNDTSLLCGRLLPMLKTVSDADLDKIKKAVKNLPLERKIEVLTMLEEELFVTRFKSLLTEFRESAKKYPITIEEITKETESVRKKRYESRN